MHKVSGYEIDMDIKFLLNDERDPDKYLHCIDMVTVPIIGEDAIVLGYYTVALFHNDEKGGYIVMTNRPRFMGDTGVLMNCHPHFKEARELSTELCLEER